MHPTVLIVDDEPTYRFLLRSLLQVNGFDVAGEAATGTDAVSAVEALHPDVVIIDIQLPDLDGFTVARKLASVPGGPQVVLCSARDESDYGDTAEARGAAGFTTRATCPPLRYSGCSIVRSLKYFAHEQTAGGHS